MDYQININHQFTAESDGEAREAAEEYIKGHLRVTALPQGMYSPREVLEQCASFRKRAKEHFYLFLLDTQNRIVGRELVSVGTLNSALIHPRETFRRAIVRNCCSVIVAHNHPSGSLEPSLEDRHVTERLVSAGRLLGIELTDHVIVTADGYFSFREAGLL